MATFTANLHAQKSSLCQIDRDLNMELMSQFPTLHPSSVHESLGSINGFSVDSYGSCQMPSFPANLWGSFSTQPSDLPDHVSTGSCKKRKANGLIETSTRNSSSMVSESGSGSRDVSGRGTTGRVKEKAYGEKKPNGVVHVRAKRGQATDSHSLAERVRRGKINEKLRCLQDMVPGCYKTMGMAVMLDEIINYVQSLQNQVEFLSMKLAAASALQDLNYQTHCLHNNQKAKFFEGDDIESLLLSSHGYEQVQAALAYFQSSWHGP